MRTIQVDRVRQVAVITASGGLTAVLLPVPREDSGGRLTIRPPKLATGAGIYAPTLAPGLVTVAPASQASGFMAYAPRVIAAGTAIIPPLLLSAAAMFFPLIQPGAATVVPPALGAGSAAFPPVVQAPAAGAILPALLAASSASFPPTVQPGAVAVQPLLLASATAFYAPVVQLVTAGTIQVTVLPSAAATFAPAITAGLVTVSPPALTSGAQRFAPAIQPGAASIAPPTLASTASFYGPSVLPGSAAIAPAVLGSAASIYAPAIQPSAVGIVPALLPSSSIVRSPSVTLAAAPTLPRLSAAINSTKAGTAPTIIATIGDSTTAGYPAGGDARRATAWPQQTKAKWIAAGVPTRSDAIWGGASVGGAAAYATYNPALTFGTGWSISTIRGVGGEYIYVNANGGNLTFTPEVSTNRFDFVHTKIGGGAIIQVSDSSGVLGTIDTSGASTAMAKTTISRATSNTNPITLTRLSGGDGYITGIRPYDTASPRLEIWNMGDVGSKVSDWINEANVYDTFSALKFVLANMPVHLTHVELGANDIAGGASAATYQSNLQTLVNAVANNAVRDTVLIKCHPANPTSDSYNLSAAYRTAIDAVSANAGLQLGIDFAASGIAIGDYQDSIHLKVSGYAKEATTQFGYVSAKV